MNDRGEAQVKVDGDGKVAVLFPEGAAWLEWSIQPWGAATLARKLLAAVAESGSFGTCKGCGDPIFWGVTADGQRRPLDIGDHPDGSMAAYKVDGVLQVRYLSRQAPLQEGERRVMPHHATCPKRDQFRKRG